MNKNVSRSANKVSKTDLESKVFLSDVERFLTLVKNKKCLGTFTHFGWSEILRWLDHNANLDQNFQIVLPSENHEFMKLLETHAHV